MPKEMLIEEKCFDKFPKVFSADYTYSPNQIVLLRLYEYDSDQFNTKEEKFQNKKYIDIPVLIRDIIFDESTGSHAPICVVDMYNYWNSGHLGGSIKLEIVIHRYVSPEPLQEKHIDIFKNYKESSFFFYVEKRDNDFYKIWPFLDASTIVTFG